MSKGTSYALLLVGGILSVLEGLIFGAAGAAFAGFPMMGGFFALLGGILAVWGIIVGLLLIWSGVKINRGGKDAHTWAIIGLVFSILGLISIQGFIIGPILALIGAALAIGNRK